MEKTIRLIGITKWLSIPLGLIMYFFTEPAFGWIPATLLGVAATVSFWALMRSEKARLIGQSIAREIKEAISESGNIESVIEIKNLKRGIIARVYLINGREKVSEVHRAITRRIENCDFKKYLWVMQLTDMPGKSYLKETQKRLNDQLIEELMKRKGR